MTAPGDFTSGEILTAADMNDLPAGLLASDNDGGDFTLTIGGIDLENVSVTLPSSRKLIVTGYLPQLDNPSTTLNVVSEILDGPIATGTALQRSICSIGSGCPSNIGIVKHRATFAAGTHDFYLAAYTSTGTARVNGAGLARRLLLTVEDVGPS